MAGFILMHRCHGMRRSRFSRVGLADVLRSVGASPRRPRVCSFVQGYLPWRAHTVEAACTPFSFEAASVPHATTRLASFLWTEGACLVALWVSVLVGVAAGRPE